MYQVDNVNSLIRTDSIAIKMKQYVAFVLLHYMSLSPCFCGGFMPLATKGLHVKCPIFVCLILTKFSFFLTYFHRSLWYQISRKAIHWELNLHTTTADGWMDGWTDSHSTALVHFFGKASHHPGLSAPPATQIWLPATYGFSQS